MTETTCRCGAIYPDTRFSCPECRRPRPLTSGGPASAASTSASAPEGSDPTDDRLPTELRGRWRIVAPLIVDSAQAELFLVVGADADDPAPTHVLKRYRRDASGDAYERGQTLARLRAVEHVGVARIEDHDPDGRWELTEYIPGGTLADLIAERQAAGGRFEEAMTESVIAGLAEALSALHTVGVFHRDLKPSNVLVRSREPLSLALTDFGGAVGTDLSVVLEQVGVATPRYAPPEWFNATTRATGDVWPLGMIALELLVGHPFDGLESVQVQARLGRQPWPVDPTGLREGVDPATAERWELLLRGTLHPDPEERWSAREVLAWTRGEDVRRPADPAGNVGATVTLSDGAFALTVAGAALVGPRELARAIAKDPASWAEGREHLRSGRLRTWAKEQLPELITRFDTTRDPDEVLLEILLTIDPMLPPSFRGRSLEPRGILRLASEAMRGDDEARSITDQLLRSDGPIRTLVELGRGEPHAELGRLREQFDAEVQGLLRAWQDLEVLGTTPLTAAPALSPELRLTLLTRILSPSGPLRRSPVSAAIMRRPRRTRRTLRRSSPTVQSILLDQIPALPLEALLGGTAAGASTDPSGAVEVLRVVAMAAVRDLTLTLLAPLIVLRRWWSGGTAPYDRIARIANAAALPSLVLWSLTASLLVGDLERLFAWSDLLVATSVAIVVATVTGVLTGGFGRTPGTVSAGVLLLGAVVSWKPGLNTFVLDGMGFPESEFAFMIPMLMCVALLPARLLGPRGRDLFVTLHRVSLVAAGAIVGVVLAGSSPGSTPAGLSAPSVLVRETLAVEEFPVPGPAVAAALLVAFAMLAGLANAVLPRRERIAPPAGGAQVPSSRMKRISVPLAGWATAILAAPLLLQIPPDIVARALSASVQTGIALNPGTLAIVVLMVFLLGRRTGGWSTPVPWDPRLATVIAVSPAVAFGLTSIAYAIARPFG